MAIAILNNANTQLCRLIKGRAACCDLPIQVTKIIGESTGQRLNTLVKLPLMSGFYHYLVVYRFAFAIAPADGGLFLFGR